MSLFRFNWPLFWVTIRSFFSRKRQLALPAPQEFSADTAKSMVKAYNDFAELEQTRLADSAMGRIQFKIEKAAKSEGLQVTTFHGYEIDEKLMDENLIDKTLGILKNRLELKGFGVQFVEHQQGVRYGSLVIKW